VQRLLAAIPLAGRRISGAARSWQRPVGAQIRAAGGAALLTVTGTQRALGRALSAPLAAAAPAVRDTALPAGRHGDRGATRALTVVPAGADGVGPGVPQVFCLPRTVQQQGTLRAQRRLGSTRLAWAAAAAAVLLLLKRGHWRIAHRLHGRRDGTRGADACPVRDAGRGHLPGA
jgi:hypothetical protein